MNNDIDDKIENIMLTLTVNHGPNGVAIYAKPPKKLADGESPIEVLVAPWIQFEPNEMSNWRESVATEIARRAANYDALLTEIEKLRNQLRKR